MTTTETTVAMDETIATIMNIKVPQFTMTGPDANFIKVVKDEFINYYIKDGKYFRNHVTLHEPYTTVFLKFDKIFNLLAPSTMNKNDRNNKITEISIKLISQIPYIMKELDTVLSSLLKTLNWEYCKLEYSNFDMSQFSGMDHSGSTPIPTFGASACMIILYMKPIHGSVPMHKPVVHKATVKEDAKDVPKMNIKGEYLDAARRGVAKVEKNNLIDSEKSDKNTNITIDDIKTSDDKPKAVSKGKRPSK